MGRFGGFASPQTIPQSLGQLLSTQAITHFQSGLWLTQSTLKYFRHHHGGVERREFLCKKAQASCIWRYRANGKRGSEASVKERTSCHSCSENTGETKYSVSHLLVFDHINQAKSRRSDAEFRTIFLQTFTDRFAQFISLARVIFSVCAYLFCYWRFFPCQGFMDRGSGTNPQRWRGWGLV